MVLVATAPTVYGIETVSVAVVFCCLASPVATAPTVYGIETIEQCFHRFNFVWIVATAPTVYGIETDTKFKGISYLYYELQQHLPFTVLKQF